LLVATVSEEGTSERRHAVHLLALGRRVAAIRELGPELLHQTAELVSNLVEEARQDGAERVGVVGTEAIRNAADGSVLRDQIRERTREQLRILTGEAEARLSYLGGTSFYVGADAPATVVDVGGGSTEVVHGTGSRPQDGVSLKLGSDRILQITRADDPPSERQLVDAETRISMVLEEAPAPARPAALIATGGTAANLPVLLGMWRPFVDSAETLHGEGPHDAWTTLDREAVERAVRLATVHSSAEVAMRTGLSPARSRLMAGGVLVLRGLLEHYHAEELVVTERGLRDGVLLRLAATPPHPPPA
jgi:exopolyphosphatase / guanosine-5'-triphosphate,3'-diphosphate pyrophosphatase